MRKKALSFIFQVVIEAMLLILVLTALLFFVTSSQNLDVKKVMLTEIAFISDILDNATLYINTANFNVSELNFDNGAFILQLAPMINYKSKVYSKKTIIVDNGIIRIK